MTEKVKLTPQSSTVSDKIVTVDSGMTTGGMVDVVIGTSSINSNVGWCDKSTLNISKQISNVAMRFVFGQKLRETETVRERQTDRDRKRQKERQRQ